MKQQVLRTRSSRMPRLVTGVFVYVLLMLGLLTSLTGNAQCGVGFNQVTLDWNNLDYFSYTGNYVSGSGYLSSNALSRTQNFAFGTQRLTIDHNYVDGSQLGENATHTGDAGSYAVGKMDIQFIGNGQVTFTFENPVNNLEFSMFDIDRNQDVSFTATTALGVPLGVTVTRLGATILTTFLNGTAFANVSSSNATIANTSNDAAINVDVAGSVKAITINVSGTGTNGSEDGSYWISNIIACSAGTFPNNYYNVSRPFTGQAGYVLHAFDDDVYAVNPATGVTKYIFTDPGGNVNSMGYDPYNRILYYTNSLTANPGANRALKKYDFNTKTITTVLADVSSIGIPLVTSTAGVSNRGTGVESGAAAFYNGSLYLGIETGAKNASGNPLGNSNREAVIWRIDFTGTTPTRASQVFAMPTDNGGGTILHDWSDFMLNDGILYDFDGAGVTTETDIYQINMLTAATTNYSTITGWTPGQPTVDWAGNLWQMYALNSSGIISYIAPYNPGAGTIGTRINLTSTPAYTPAIPSLGDAAEGFRPLVDYGDAPASYDPLPGDPAVHELITNLRLGANESDEWVTRGQTILADQDNFEDGLGAAPALLNFNGTINYSVPNISVFNNTGANATLIAWLDYNMNGVFEAGEGRTATVASSASAQLVTITWTGILVPASAATNTFLRIRLTRAANGMTTANMNGFMLDGEVEDYRVTLGLNLPVEITSFDLAKGNGKTANLKWTTSGDMAGNAAFEIERSTNGQQWIKAGSINTALLEPETSQFSYTDANAVSGKSYYRIKIVSKDGAYKYTAVKTIVFTYLKGKIKVSPNPATDNIAVQLSLEQASTVKVTMFNYAGKTVYEKTVSIAAGDNSIRLNDLRNPAPGIYYIKLNIGEEVFTDKLVILKN